MTPATITLTLGLLLTAGGAAYVVHDVRAYLRVLAAQDSLLAQQQAMIEARDGEVQQTQQKVELMGKFVRVLVERNREIAQ